MKTVLIGCGGVGKCILEIIPKIKWFPKKLLDELIIIDPNIFKHSFHKKVIEELIEELKNKYSIKIKIIKKPITKNNLTTLLLPLLDSNTLVIDVSINIDGIEIIKLCQKQNTFYINTSLEVWEIPEPEKLTTDISKLYKRTLHYQHYRLEQQNKQNKIKHTIICEFGMNPGIISVFVLLALKSYAKSIKNYEAVKLIDRGNYAKAAYLLKLSVIHVAEQDTQEINRNFINKTYKNFNWSETFINTWSPSGYYEEGRDPIQLGWNPKDKSNVKLYKPSDYQRGAKDNIRFGRTRGYDMKLHSVVPNRNNGFTKIKGFAIPHGEASSLSERLTYKITGHEVYRPSVYYVYDSSPISKISIKRLKENNYKTPKYTHNLLLSDLKNGYDSVGALLMFDNVAEPYYAGTILSTADVKHMGFKYSSPTVVQVAISILSAVKWMMDNQNKGLCYAEDLPFEYIYKLCKPFLGKIYMGKIPVPMKKHTITELIAK